MLTLHLLNGMRLEEGYGRGGSQWEEERAGGRCDFSNLSPKTVEAFIDVIDVEFVILSGQ